MSGKSDKPNPPLPAKPEAKQLQTTDTALASAIKAMTGKEAIEILCNIREGEKVRYALLLSISKDYGLDFLETYTLSELCLSAGIKGRRSEQITEISKQPSVLMPQQEGLWGRMKGRFNR